MTKIEARFVTPMKHISQRMAEQKRRFPKLTLKTPAKRIPPEPSIELDERCRLLKLPAEIRAMIYEYALTEQGGLVISGGHLHSARVDSEECDANQLKFVCKQLHAETKGLGLRYNILTIKDSDSRLWFGTFEKFVNHECSSENLRRLTEVILHDRIERFEDRMHRRFSRERGVTQMAILERQLNAICSPHFKACCQKLPRATITIRLEVCRAHPDFFAWAEIGSLVQYLHRGTKSRMWEDGMLWTREAGDMAQRFLAHSPSPFPANVRLTPASYEVAQFGLSEDFNGMDPITRAAWLKQGQSWYDNGF